MPFSIACIDFDAARHLQPGPYKLYTALARYADKAGECFPLYRQLGEDVGVSIATISRWMAALDAAGVFIRKRLAGGGRYLYTLAEAFRPQLPVSKMKNRFSQREKQEANPAKHSRNSIRYEGELPDERAKWPARMRWWRKDGSWPLDAGPKPGEPNCQVPPELLAM